MKRLSILLTFMMILLLGCSKVEDSANIAVDVSSSPEVESSAVVEVIPEKNYFTYLNSEPKETLFMGDDGLDDLAMSAFAFSKASMLVDGFDFETGVSPQVLDEITTKYFGKTLSTYENRYITLLENGNVGSTGWSPSGCSLVLEELSAGEDGEKIGIFYKVSTERPAEMSYEEYLVRIFAKDFTELSEPTLVEIVFHEKEDESGADYFEFVSVRTIEV